MFVTTINIMIWIIILFHLGVEYRTPELCWYCCIETQQFVSGSKKAAHQKSKKNKKTKHKMNIISKKTVKKQTDVALKEEDKRQMRHESTTFGLQRRWTYRFFDRIQSWTQREEPPPTFKRFCIRRVRHFDVHAPRTNPSPRPGCLGGLPVGFSSGGG